MREMTIKALQEMGISESIRGEAMTLQEFAEFTNRVERMRNLS